MRVLVCGDRNWSDQHVLNKVLDQRHSAAPITCVIEGEALGADRMGRMWAEANKVAVLPFPADWQRYGRAAGPIRNLQMLLDGKPDLVLAFHSNIERSKGTADMVRRARKAGILVEVVDGDPNDA